MQRVTMTIDDDLLAALDASVAARGYQGRSEAIRDILREALGAERQAAHRTQCVAALTYVYDHHKRNLAERLTDLQHDHHDLTVAAVHVHLDHETCLEVAVMKGRTGDVRALADEITSERGVRHGHLHIIPATGGTV
jgi:CopG family nickel-responsive transcriptional regulator